MYNKIGVREKLDASMKKKRFFLKSSEETKRIQTGIACTTNQ